MSEIVIDANVALDWLIPSPQGEAYSLKLFDIFQKSDIQFIVPLHFDVEVTRVLRKKHKHSQGEFDAEWLSASLRALDSVEFHAVALGISFEMLGSLAEVYNLDIPDVPYLHLARTLEAPIATRDGGIITACKNWNVRRWTP